MLFLRLSFGTGRAGSYCVRHEPCEVSKGHASQGTLSQIPEFKSGVRAVTREEAMGNYLVMFAGGLHCKWDFCPA